MLTATTKQTYRAILLALQADAKAHPGGICALASQMGVNHSALANQLNPNHDVNPPCFGKVLEIINLTQGTRTTTALCQIVGMVPIAVDEPADTNTGGSQIAELLQMCSQLAEFLKTSTDAASDLKIDSQERGVLKLMLTDLINRAAQLSRTLA